MKLEENMYVRTKNGEIHKIKSIDDNFLKYENGFGVPLVLGGHIVKASHNIIDLIEVGDYVNGNKIIKISTDHCGRNILIYGYDDGDRQVVITIYEDEIKSIVTKEQFEQMKYKVGE